MLPIRFEYFDELSMQIVYASIIRQIKQHFTGETMYLVRKEYQDGMVFDAYRSEAEVKAMLEHRTEVNK